VERMFAKIKIGGRLPRSLVPELCRVIACQEVQLQAGDSPFTPEIEADLEEAVGGNRHIELEDDGSPGDFEDIEAFCRENDLPFDVWHETKYEYDALLHIFRPGQEDVMLRTDANERPLVGYDKVRCVIGMIRDGESTDAVAVALLKIAPEIPDLPPFEVVDG
jgi:hypothetical protein